MKFSKWIVLAIIALNIGFTVAILYVFLRTGGEPYALVSAWFTFTSVELWSLAKIKRTEIEEDYSENQLCNGRIDDPIDTYYYGTDTIPEREENGEGGNGSSGSRGTAI